MSAISFQSHDHQTCIADGVKAAEKACAQSGLKLTPQRRRVLEILLQEHRAMGAYDILDVLQRDGFTAQPPVAYRALDFLVTNGFAHKVERLNAFVACSHPGHDHTPALLICRSCKTVAEAPSGPARSALVNSSVAAGFNIETVVVEAIGICPACQASA